MDKDWVGIGKQWADVPPWVKRTVAVILTIPNTIHQQLLPSKNLSIHQLIDFTLPKGAAVLSTATSLDYFCHNPPDLLSESSLQNKEASDAFSFCHQKTCCRCETSLARWFQVSEIHLKWVFLMSAVSLMLLIKNILTGL